MAALVQTTRAAWVCCVHSLAWARSSALTVPALPLPAP